MRLGAWLAAHRLSDAQFARAVGADRAQVWRWRNGAIPSAKHLRAIYQFTDAAVAPNDFFDLGLGRKTTRRRRQE